MKTTPRWLYDTLLHFSIEALILIVSFILIVGMIEGMKLVNYIFSQST